jgi:hypothetical protein
MIKTELQNNERVAILLAVVMTLIPLIPYALEGLNR